MRDETHHEAILEPDRNIDRGGRTLAHHTGGWDWAGRDAEEEQTPNGGGGAESSEELRTERGTRGGISNDGRFVWRNCKRDFSS